MSKYPVNYDFGKYWDTKIIDLLDHPDIKDAIRKGINKYLKSRGWDGKYEKDTVPAAYTDSFYYADIMRRLDKRVYQRLIEKDKVPLELLKLECYTNSFDDDDAIKDVYENDLHEKKHKFLNKKFPWSSKKYDMETYCVVDSSHSWAPTFELTLAKLVKPKEEWRVLKGHKHSTVINKDNTKVFDLLTWALLDNRLEEFIFDDYSSHDDPTLGGMKAYLDSNLKYCDCKKCIKNKKNKKEV